MSYFAERLKHLRIESGLTMQTLADEAKVSKSMICKIEHDEVQPTLDVASRLAKALGKTLSEMLHPTQAAEALLLTRDQQAVWEDSQHIVRRNISPVFEGLKIEWLHVELPPKAVIAKSLTTMAKGGEKYILVTKGSLGVKINEKIYQLNKGDSIYFDSNSPHDFYNSGKTVAEYYVVIKHS